MIRKTLAETQAATFSVDLPNPAFHDMPTPYGTGFFVSGDGWFVTAAHVVADADGNPRSDIEQTWLLKETRMERMISGGAMCQWPDLRIFDSRLDIAIFKVDFERNKNKAWLKERTHFPHIRVSRRDLEEGEPVYAFGYPLADAHLEVKNEAMTFGTVEHKPRVTSAIVASTMETTRTVMTDADVRVYVLDKALNYGNSGGPILATETGHVHACCSRFQPVWIRQEDLTRVMVPSLYGVATSLSNPQILDFLGSQGVPIAVD